GWTLLMYAASIANVEIVQLLLDRGANASFDKGFNMGKIINVVLKFLELGANKMLQTKDGKTPSEIAKRNKHLEERDMTLRHLLTMKKDEFAKFGITKNDQQKILAAVKELEVEEIHFGELPEVAKLEVRGSPPGVQERWLRDQQTHHAPPPGRPPANPQFESKQLAMQLLLRQSPGAPVVAPNPSAVLSRLLYVDPSCSSLLLQRGEGRLAEQLYFTKFPVFRGYRPIRDASPTGEAHPAALSWSQVSHYLLF
ncbi:Ankyrin repeat, SAM and basic leucine zipper domain-containing protein 1, partial [Sciurus carolinensis]|nr:Ankyrin repeat, SAM and basic leucine zipper domain-containing protein 1 [Sciurus carolinensis]